MKYAGDEIYKKGLVAVDTHRTMPHPDIASLTVRKPTSGTLKRRRALRCRTLCCDWVGTSQDDTFVIVDFLNYNTEYMNDNLLLKVHIAQ